LVAAEAADAFEAGAEKLGWNATVVDGKFDPNLWLEGIRQAVAAQADGIWLIFFDCAPVRAGLEAAKRADIPVIASAGFDCNADDPDAPSLFTWETRYVEGTFPDFQAAWGEAQAYWTIANTDGQAKVLSFIETDLKGTLIIGEEFESTIRECADCEIVDTIEFTGRDFGPALQQKAEQALLANPDADVVYANYDGPITAGIGAAVRASGRDLRVIGGEGLPPNLELIQDGRQDVALGYVAGWEAYAALDALLRIHAGEKPTKQTGLGVQITDADHNLPPAGEPYDPEIDWQGLYERAWGVD
jgi:ribose transport system substrate-binding protein